MATYPAYTFHLSSSQRPESEYVDDFDDSGGQHARQFRSQRYWNYKLIHKLTQAEFDALLAFYDAGPRDTHTLTYYDSSPTVTYSVQFTAVPEKKVNHGDGFYTVEVNLRGYQN